MLGILTVRRRITVELICASLVVVFGLGGVTAGALRPLEAQSMQLDVGGQPSDGAETLTGGAAAVEPAADHAASHPKETGNLRADLTAAELDLLARLIRAEAQGEPYAGKVAVAAVVLNRMESRLFPKTVRGVIYQRRQFEPVDNGTINRKADALSVRAAQDALRGDDPSRGALYFFNPAKTRNRFLWARRVTVIIGRHRFTL
ncbi:MAG: cell wall hydrolase [Bacillota bacterium]